MLTIPPPMSNAERQRRFQLARPGYDRRRKARERGGAKRMAAPMRRQRELQAQAAAAQAAQTPVETVAQAPAQVIASRPLLMLPAPVVDPVMAQINQLAASRVARAAGVERQGEGCCRFSATPVR